MFLPRVLKRPFSDPASPSGLPDVPLCSSRRHLCPANGFTGKRKRGLWWRYGTTGKVFVMPLQGSSVLFGVDIHAEPAPTGLFAVFWPVAQPG